MSGPKSWSEGWVLLLRGLTWASPPQSPLPPPGSLGAFPGTPPPTSLPGALASTSSVE